MRTIRTRIDKIISDNTIKKESVKKGTKHFIDDKV